jgi:hypothetical protein
MKPYLLFLLWVLSYPVFAQANTDYNKLVGHHLTGKVKLCVETSNYRIDSLLFNERGYLVEDKSWDIQRELMSTGTYTYKDTLIEKSTRTHWGKKDSYQYHYDSLGRCTLETCNGKPSEITSYDEHGNVKEVFIYKEDTLRNRHIIFDYDNQDRLVEVKQFYTDTFSNSRTVHSYGINSHTRVAYSHSGINIYVSVNEGTDLEAELVYSDSVSPSSLRMKYSWLRNSRGVVVQHAAEYVKEISNTYGQIAAGTIKTTDLTYEYDLHGNWTRVMTSGESNYTDTRIITYYEP